MTLLDVRSPAEFRAVHADGAVNVPLGDVDATAYEGRRVNVICQTGGRARQAAETLAGGGVEAAVVRGGTVAWEAAGLPVVRGKKSVSLERQVRIAAGLLVLIGVGLSLLVHPWFVGLSAFVGAGLLFSGVTDTCGMGTVLAKMPWNRR